MADTDRITFIAGSHHLNATYNFNEFNPGVVATWEDVNTPIGAMDLSLGAVWNSYSRGSAVVNVAKPLLPGKSEHPRDWDIYAFAAVMHYPVDGRNFSTSLGGDTVFLGGLQARYRNVFAQVVPCFCDITDAIFAFGLTFSTEELGWRQ